MAREPSLRSWSLLLAAVAAAPLFSGCSTRSLSSPGPCPAGVYVDYGPIQQVLFDPSSTWVSAVRVTTAPKPKPTVAAATRADLAGLHPVRLDGFSVVNQGSPVLRDGVIVWVDGADRGLLGRASSHNLRTLIKVEPADVSRSGAALIGSAFGENADGSLTVNGCGNGYSDYFTRLGLTSGLTAAEALNEVLAHPSGQLAETVRNADRTPPTVPWVSQPPDQRGIDNAPDSVKAKLGNVELAFKIPSAWRTLGGALCSHTALGLNGCTAFTAANFVQARNAWVVLADAWFTPGQPLTVTYQPPAPPSAASSVTIAQVSPTILQSGHGINTYVVFNLTGLASPSDLLHQNARFEGVEQCCS